MVGLMSNLFRVDNKKMVLLGGSSIDFNKAFVALFVRR